MRIQKQSKLGYKLLLVVSIGPEIHDQLIFVCEFQDTCMLL